MPRRAQGGDTERGLAAATRGTLACAIAITRKLRRLRPRRSAATSPTIAGMFHVKHRERI
jgi:hypothetical protein